MQTLFIDNQDGKGARDFTKFFKSNQFFTHSKNTPALFEFDVQQASGVPGWVVPDRGAYVRFEDNRWISRDPGVPDGVVFTGYVVSPPNPTVVGSAEGVDAIVYHLQVASDDWLANTHTLPAKTYIDKTHGEILKDLLLEMFKDADIFPYDLSGVADGGRERIYQIDTTKKWTEIAASFAAVDGFVYRVIDRRFLYHPELQFASIDPEMGIRIDQSDPRFDPYNLGLTRVAASLVNDVTVFGEVEPTNFVHESYVSDGYQGAFPLSSTPYGIAELDLLTDDFTSGSINLSTWQHVDTAVNSYIQPFQGSLNIIGGPGADTGSVYLRSRKGVELSGFVYTRDGEIFFPPNATGAGVIGGLYSDDDMREAHCWSGWYLDLNALRIYPLSADGRELSSGHPINLAHHYVLRRQIAVDSTFRALNQYVVKTSFGQFVVGGEAPPSGATVSWVLEEVNADDPNQIVTSQTLLLQKRFENIPPYALYAPIVPYDCHLVMNYVQVYKPQQISVLVNNVPVQVGSYLDGGKCRLSVDGDHASLNWYGVNRGNTSTDGNTENVTIPPQRAVVDIFYYQSGQSVARLISADSIQRERQRFKDDGVRQTTLRAEDGKPTPRNSEECLFLAQAFLSDRIEARYEGTYKFRTGENDSTLLLVWPCPGDQVPARALQVDGTYIDTMLDVTRVSSTFIGGGAYEFNLEIGPLNRFDEVERALYLQHASSLDTDLPSIVDIDPESIEVLKTTGDVRPADPLKFSTSNITPTTFTLTLSSVTPDQVAGYEVRNDDTGWGQGGYVLRTAASVFTLPRARRDVTYFVRPFNTAGEYSRRSARVRVVYPLANNIAIVGVTGEITPDTLTINIPLPVDPDFSGVRVTVNSGTLVYDGDGITTNAAMAGVNAVAGSGTLSIEAPNTGQSRSYVVTVQSYNLIGQYGPIFNFTITKFTPAIVVPPAPLPANPNVWTWSGQNASTYEITTFGPSGSPDSSWQVPSAITDWNFGSRGDTDLTVDIAPIDDWGQGLPRVSSNGGDTDLPSAPDLSVRVGPPDDPNVQTRQVFKLSWTTPTQNARGITEYVINVCFSPAFDADVEEYTYPSNLNNADFFYPGTQRYFRVAASNAFGVGPWSNLATAEAPDPLDPLSVGDNYDYSNPVFDPFISTGGINGMPNKFGWQLNDGATRSIDGLTPVGFVGLNLPFSLQQFDPLGAARTIVRNDMGVSTLSDGSLVVDGSARGRSGLTLGGGVNQNLPFGIRQFNGGGTAEDLIRSDMSVNSLLDGGVVTDGSSRARTGFNTSGFLSQNIPFGIGMLDASAVLRTVILNSMAVAALIDGGSVSSGGFRALAAISAANLIVSSLAFGVHMFDGGGNSRTIMNNANSVQSMVDGGTAFSGGSRALIGLDAGGTLLTLLVNGMLGHGIFYSSDQMQEGIRAGRFAIQPLVGFGDQGSFRIWDNQVDQFSIAQNGVAGINITGAYRSANSWNDGGGGFGQEFRI